MQKSEELKNLLTVPLKQSVSELWQLKCKKPVSILGSENWICLKNMYSRVWNKRSPLNKHSPLENLAKRISVAPFFTLCYGVRNKAVAPG